VARSQARPSNSVRPTCSGVGSGLGGNKHGALNLTVKGTKTLIKAVTTMALAKLLSLS